MGRALPKELAGEGGEAFPSHLDAGGMGWRLGSGRFDPVATVAFGPVQGFVGAFGQTREFVNLAVGDADAGRDVQLLVFEFRFDAPSHRFRRGLQSGRGNSGQKQQELLASPAGRDVWLWG